MICASHRTPHRWYFAIYGTHDHKLAGEKRQDVREEDVTGLKYFDKLAPLLARLHDVGCGTQATAAIQPRMNTLASFTRTALPLSAVIFSLGPAPFRRKIAV